MLKTDEQIRDTIKKAGNVLITCRENAHIDSLSSCLSLYLLLQKLNIPAEVVVSAPKELVGKCEFLPRSSEIVCSGGSLRDLVIKVESKDAKLGKFRYEVEGDTLNIYVSPENGSFSPSDVRTEVSSPGHDLIITCDTPDLDSIGALYHEHADFFYKTPIINIDHSPANEQYGQINYVDITAVSTTELLFRLLETIGDEYLNDDMATVLLAGMISKTESFKTPSVTPRALMVASELVQRGARRDEIVHHLYRQHDISTLRLWGRVLARIKHNDKKQFVWSVVTREDFQKSGASEKYLPGIIDELIMTTPQAETVALLYERSDGHIGGWLKTAPHVSAVEITKPWQGKGSRVLSQFVLPVKSLEEAEKELAQVLNGNTFSTNNSHTI